MSRKTKIIVSIVGIVLVSLILVGLTFGYYLTNIVGNTNDKSITLSIANLELTYSDGNGLIEAEKIIPGEDIDKKTFSVENTGDAKVENYTVYLDSVENSFLDKSDVKLTLTCKSSNGGNCSGTNITYPSTSTMLSVNDIDVGEIHNYELIVEFLETNDDQSDNMNKSLSGNIKIKDINSTGKTSNTLASVNTVTLNNNEYISNYRIYGNTIQNGNPSPTSPVSIQSVGDYDSETGKYVIPIIATGKNLFDGQFEIGFINATTGLSHDTTNSIYWRTTNYIKVVPNMVFSYTKYLADSGLFVYCYDENKNYLGHTDKIYNDIARITNDVFLEGTEYIRIFWELQSATDDIKKVFDYVQVEQGTTATEYEPYKETVTNIYLDEPLRKINEFSDYIDFQEQKVVRNVKEINLTGNETWTTISGNAPYVLNTNDRESVFRGNLNIMSTHFITVSNADSWVNYDSMLSVSSGNAKYIVFRYTTYSDLTSFKSWISSNFVKVAYVLENKKINFVKLPSILLQDGISNISVGTSIQPSNVEYKVIK